MNRSRQARLNKRASRSPPLSELERGPAKGRLICVMRTGRENPMYQAESDDDGKTWTPPRRLQWTYSNFGRSRDMVGTDPDIIELTDGTLVLAYGHKPDYQDDGKFLTFSLRAAPGCKRLGYLGPHDGVSWHSRGCAE